MPSRDIRPVVPCADNVRLSLNMNVGIFLGGGGDGVGGGISSAFV